MNDRFIQLIEALHYSPSHFADEIGVIRSSISHILTGRNKPGVDLIQKVLTRFPEVSSEWLLLGVGEMMKNAAPQPVSMPAILPSADRTEPAPKPKEMRQMTLDDYAPPHPDDQKKSVENVKPEQTDIAAVLAHNLQDANSAQAGGIQTTGKVGIKRITVYFSDNTFQDFIPG